MGFNQAEVLTFLQESEIQVEGYVPWGSNHTYVTTLCQAGQEHLAVYKPQRGERPLWDFPAGTLCQRERAAYLVSEALAWSLVPPTILRDGPRGWGSVQYFIEHDPNITFFDFQHDHPEQLRQIALFDILINNADRKGGHVLRDGENRLWAIDHGITFHFQYKLRTVIWDFAGEVIPAEFLPPLEQLQTHLNDEQNPLTVELGQLLNKQENKALRKRLQMMLESRRFIDPGPGRHYPWPLV